jgi:hypothetical protein
MTEFNLSEKIVFPEGKTEGKGIIYTEDFKEFIRLLKDEIGDYF